MVGEQKGLTLGDFGRLRVGLSPASVNETDRASAAADLAFSSAHAARLTGGLVGCACDNSASRACLLACLLTCTALQGYCTTVSHRLQGLKILGLHENARRPSPVWLAHPPLIRAHISGHAAARPSCRVLVWLASQPHSGRSASGASEGSGSAGPSEVYMRAIPWDGRVMQSFAWCMSACVDEWSWWWPSTR